MQILYLLSTATGSLLDDDELVTVLQSSKTIAIEVTEQVRAHELKASLHLIPVFVPAWTRKFVKYPCKNAL
jgi:hypothetical protein